MLEMVRQMPLFADLTNEQLQWLSARSGQLSLSPGDFLFTEGDQATCFHVVLSGLLRITKQVEGQETEIDLHEAGMFTGDIGLLIGLPHVATARAVRPTHLLVFGADIFQQLVVMVPALGRAMLPLMMARVQGAEVLMREREKLAALGKLSAGLAHELNNPAAAGRRAAEQLGNTFGELHARTLQLTGLQLSPPQRAMLADVQGEGRHRAKQAETAPPLDPLAQNDQEEAVVTWLEEHRIPDGWQLAPTLVTARLNIGWLDALGEHFPADVLPAVLRWLEAMLSAESLVKEVGQSTARISELVGAVKTYSHMDQAPQQEVDIHEGLESTLTILKHKLKGGSIAVTREYASDLQRIPAYGSELNQVWTNLIDNAIDALNTEEGRDKHLWLRTSRDGERVLVEIVDNGPGIPLEVQARIFQPFFTTKRMGEGTGLGLDVSYCIVVNRHHGDLRVTSKPGNTRLQVRLPMSQPMRSTGDDRL